jgi:hypothetical protein
MSPVDFYKLVLTLWGEDWRPRLLALLSENGYSVTRQTLWNWRKGKTPVPKAIVELLGKAR